MLSTSRTKTASANTSAAPTPRLPITRNASAISSLDRASTTWTLTFSARAVASTSRVRGGCEAFVGFASSAIDARLGTAAWSSSICFAAISVPRKLSPVTLPPGRDRLPTRPTATGSAGIVMTIGTVRVTCFAASAVCVDETTMTSTRLRTSSSIAASAGSVLGST